MYEKGWCNPEKLKGKLESQSLGKDYIIKSLG